MQNLYLMGRVRDIHDPEFKPTINEELKKLSGNGINFHCDWENGFNCINISLSALFPRYCKWDKDIANEWIGVPKFYSDLILKPETIIWDDEHLYPPYNQFILPYDVFAAHYKEVNLAKGGWDWKDLSFYDSEYGICLNIRFY